MSGSKKRSGFQITSVTSDINHTPGKQVPRSALLSIVQAAVSSGSSSQPTTPTSKRKFISHDTLGHGAGCSRFRVVRLAVGGAGGNRRGEPYCRGRWTCTDFLELKEGTRFKRLMDTMRHAHSLDSLEMIGREPESGRDPTQRHTNPVRGRDGPGLTLHSGPPSPTHKEPISLHLLHSREEMGSPPLLPPARPRILPSPLRLDVDASGRVRTWACAAATLSNAGNIFYNFRNIKNACTMHAIPHERTPPEQHQQVLFWLITLVQNEYVNYNRASFSQHSFKFHWNQICDHHINLFSVQLNPWLRSLRGN